MAGYTNVRSASNAWAAVNKKITAQAAGITGDNANAETIVTPKAKVTPRKRGRKAAGEDGEDDPTAAKVR